MNPPPLLWPLPNSKFSWQLSQNGHQKIPNFVHPNSIPRTYQNHNSNLSTARKTARKSKTLMVFMTNSLKNIFAPRGLRPQIQSYPKIFPMSFPFQ